MSSDDKNMCIYMIYVKAQNEIHNEYAEAVHTNTTKCNKSTRELDYIKSKCAHEMKISNEMWHKPA